MSMKKMLTFKSNDGKEFEIDEKVAVQSITIKNMMENDCIPSVIPLPIIHSQTLKTIIEYLNKHHEVDEPSYDLRKFDAEFAKKKYSVLQDIVLAANYLQIKDLLELCCQTIADLIKDKPHKEVRELFGIKNDFTPEEEARIRNENAWAFAGYD